MHVSFSWFFMYLFVMGYVANGWFICLFSRGASILRLVATRRGKELLCSKWRIRSCSFTVFAILQCCFSLSMDWFLVAIFYLWNTFCGWQVKAIANINDYLFTMNCNFHLFVFILLACFWVTSILFGSRFGYVLLSTRIIYCYYTFGKLEVYMKSLLDCVGCGFLLYIELSFICTVFICISVWTS